MNNITVTCVGTTSEINTDFFPPITPPEGKQYSVGLLSFTTYNTIPNIQEGCNKFYYANSKVFQFETGTYELEDINQTLQSALGHDKISITGNHSTLKTTLSCVHDVDFTPSDSIAPLLGFAPRLLTHKKGQDHVSDNKVDIFSVSAINIELDIAQSDYKNGQPTHYIHQYVPDVPAGYRLISVPKNVIYYPIQTRDIEKFTIRLVDNREKLVNFRGEEISVRLHFRAE